MTNKFFNIILLAMSTFTVHTVYILFATSDFSVTGLTAGTKIKMIF